jgi:F0F1-type ATP synthase beta subunit
VEDFLAPTLKVAQVVVLDGLGVHKTKKVRELIEGRERIYCFCHPTHRISIP